MPAPIPEFIRQKKRERANTPAPAWLHNTVTDGIQLLLGLGLPGSPGYDAAEQVLYSWVTALWRMDKDWDEEADAWRLREAFTQAAGSLGRWPAPKEIVDLMPPRVGHTPLEKPSLSEEQIAENKRRLREAARDAGLFARRP